MKYVFLLAIALVACSVNAYYEPTDALINAIIAVESHGNNKAIGDTHLKNKAYGCLQIRKGVLIDVNNRFNTTYTNDDCFNREKSIKIFKLYMKIYKPSNEEECARMWNGGPKGHKKNSTENYWKLVKKKM